MSFKEAFAAGEPDDSSTWPQGKNMTEINEAELSADQPLQSTVEVNLNIDPSTFRNLIKEVSGRTITSQQASNLLDVFGEELKLELNGTIRGFAARHFGKKK